MLGINPYLSFKGTCRQAIEFYQAALNAEILFSQTVGESPMANLGPPENIMHCTLKVGESAIMMSDDPGPAPPTGAGNISLAIGLNDPARARELFESLAEGGQVIMPLTKTYWAESFGVLTDKFGIRWMVNCDAPH